jgi:formate dehydrogenase iron-sulfur subunit
MHCSDPGCLKACTSPGAIVQYANGIVDFDQEKCIGCKMCSVGCPFNVPRFDGNNKPFKCNFCLDRVSSALEPACAKACPTNCLSFGFKDDMVMKGRQIVERLKAGGFSNAKLYDPKGVGGTGYIYVLPHGDKTEMYGQLPADPSVSMLVEFWKGPLKYVGGLALLGTLIGVLSHLITYGPIKTEQHDKEE